MSKAPQTEEEERTTLIYEFGWMCGRVEKLTGKFPAELEQHFAQHGVLCISAIPTADLAAMNAAIRATYPWLDLAADLDAQGITSLRAEIRAALKEP